MDYTKITLGELLTHTNETIKRNSMSILKTLQKSYSTCPQCDTIQKIKDIEYLGEQEYQCPKCK